MNGEWMEVAEELRELAAFLSIGWNENCETR
jgi:hypothetical protein